MPLLKPITLPEVRAHLARFFHAVHTSRTGAGIAPFFARRHACIHAPDGSFFDLDAHQRLHARWTDETHVLGDFTVTPVSTNPPRVRAAGTVYWEARYKKPLRGPSLIKAVVGEDYFIERAPNGSLRFTLYHTTSFHPLPDSAPIILT